MRRDEVFGLAEHSQFVSVPEGTMRSGGFLHEARAYDFWKRVLDVFLSFALLLLLAVPMLLVAVAVRCDSSGGAIFRQTRLGKNLEPFTIYKFRTMTVSSPHYRPSAELSQEERERCVTSVGRFLRRTSLDEVPQLWNVLLGDMSLVGPRPVIAAEGALHALRTELGATRVRPGITGLAQLKGRDGLGAAEKARLDAVYAELRSFCLDARILLGTFKTVISGEGGD